MSDAHEGTTDVVRRRLEAAGIRVSGEELDVATDLYRFYKEQVQRLYDAPGVRYSEPALVFRAAPPLDDWKG
jgi:hypothetical protein